MLPRLPLLVAVLWCAVLPLSALAAESEWQNVTGQADLERGVGTWSTRDGALQVTASPGARVPLKVQPAAEYDFRVTFTRTSGIHSIAVMFVVDGRPTVCDIDAWGQHLAGIQRVNGRTLRERPTPPQRATLKNGEKGVVLVEVRRDQVRVLLDGKEIDTVPREGTELSIVDEWRLPAPGLGVGSWESAATFHAIEYRPVAGATLATTPTRPGTSGTAPAPGPAAAAAPGATPVAGGAGRPAAGGKPAPVGKPAGGAKPADAAAQRVLIVIANQDFFYREYADPRQELERAGIQVEVAAARKGACRPHANSGQGNDGGTVQADLALADVKPERYAAILFAGGWGASQYQYAFRGRYRNGGYNGSPELRNRANELINAFVKEDKYVAGLCHGVSVLAWSRVNGKSLLDGRAVCAATLPSPDGDHPGASGVPASRWHAEVNGGRMHPGNSVGNPNTSADDVAVDGKVITGQDDHSARELGRTLAGLLRAP